MSCASVPAVTPSAMHAAGERGGCDARWCSSANIRLEVLCEEAIATQIAAHLQATNYANYAVVLFISDVTVLRPGNF